MHATPARDRDARFAAWHRPLTATEDRVIRMVARGLGNKQIAGELGISEQTVKNHVTSILRKLHADSRLDALYALGWIAVPPANDPQEITRARLRTIADSAHGLGEELHEIESRARERLT